MADPESQSCRIIIVSSTTSLARDIAHRIKTISGDTSPHTSGDDAALGQDISWKISNKYYSADVHFRAIQLEHLEHEGLDDVPAFIYVWKGDESFKEEMKTVSQHISSKEFEVSLAISTQPTLRDDLEDHFFGHGLEYIDGASPFTHNSAAESDGSVAPGIHRALDALSTIMWPSMVRSMTKPSHTSRSQSLDDSDLALQALIADAGASSDELSTSRASRLQKEMDELERWLEDGDYDSENDPWKMSTLSSKDMKKEDLKSGKGVSDGFDDDFADFVSAPSLSLVPSDPLNPSATDDTHPFAPLGDDEDDSDGLPSRADIETTASRIFHQTSDRSGEPNQDIGDDDERDAPAFDLSRILSALQGMKEEIAGIEDEAERRKAAAKVALGLVYGLEGFSEGDEETDTGRSKGIA